jgi:hypothetical protein
MMKGKLRLHSNNKEEQWREMQYTPIRLEGIQIDGPDDIFRYILGGSVELVLEDGVQKTGQANDTGRVMWK